MTEGGNVLTSADGLFTILEHLKERGSGGVTELATELDMPKSSVQVYLNTLYEHGFLERTDGTYGVGLRFLEYGMASLRDEPIFPEARAKVRDLADATGELAACFVEERLEGVYAYGEGGDRAISTDLSIGERQGLHCTASGKAILAHLPAETVRRVIDERGLEARTDRTITDPDRLETELDGIRDRGVAVSREESVTGMRAVAAPVVVDGNVLGSISLAGPTHRFVGDRFEEELPNLVTGAAGEIELNTTYSESGL